MVIVSWLLDVGSLLLVFGWCLSGDGGCVVSFWSAVLFLVVVRVVCCIAGVIDVVAGELLLWLSLFVMVVVIVGLAFIMQVCVIMFVFA